MDAYGTPTLADVARAAGVSLATASRVVSGGSSVSEALEQRVTRAARSLGYVASSPARAMRGHSNTVALIADDVATEAMGEIVSSMEIAARRAGAIATVSASGGDPVRQLKSLRVLRALRPRAIVLTGTWLESSGMQELIEAELRGYVEQEGGRVVVIGRTRLPYPFIAFDDAASALLVGEHMASSGRGSALVLAGPQGHPAFTPRSAAFRAALEARDVDDIRVVHSEGTREDAARACGEALGERVPGLVLAANDVLAVGALRALHEHGADVPADVLLSGFDDVPIAKDLSPALTTVALPFATVGRRVLELALAEDAAPAATELLGTLVVRASSAHH